MLETLRPPPTGGKPTAEVLLTVAAHLSRAAESAKRAAALGPYTSEDGLVNRDLWGLTRHAVEKAACAANLGTEVLAAFEVRGVEEFACADLLFDDPAARRDFVDPDLDPRNASAAVET